MNSVSCIEETDEVGADEILLGGSTIDHKGTVRPFSHFKVGDDFDKGDTRRFDYRICRGQKRNVPLICPNGSTADPHRGKQLGRNLDLLQPGPWPRVYAVALLMGEEDTSGGFGKMLTAAWDELEDEAKTLIEELGDELGAAIGGEFGEILGDIIGYIILAVVGWLIALFDNPDDPIAAQGYGVEFASAMQLQAKHRKPLTTPPNQWAAPFKTLHFKGDGGHYKVQMHWRGVAP